MTRHENPAMQDIPLSGPEGQTVTRPSRRRTKIWIVFVVIALVLGAVAMTSQHPASKLALFLRALAGKN
jgi:hypothetical protein